VTTSYVERSINTTVMLGAGASFAGTSSNVVKIGGSGAALTPGVRTSVAVVKAGGKYPSTAQIRIFGLPLSIMNQLATLGVPYAYFISNNTVLVEAGDVGGIMSAVFQGNVQQAWFDGDPAPEVPFNIIATTGALNAAAPALPTSYPGAADVGTILAGLAARAGYNFQNNGVQQSLRSPYFSGSIQNQILTCIEHARIEYIIDNGTLIIWPHNGTRGGVPPLISPTTGLVSYPRYTTQGVHFRSLFNPAIGYGQPVQLQSSLVQATGTWTVFRLAYDLEDQTPDGAWFVDVDAQKTGNSIAPQV
jgi:hypothetical protein